MQEPEFSCTSSAPPGNKDIPNDQVLFLTDLDGTLTRPGSELLIQRFVEDTQIGAAHRRRELLNCFNKWSEERGKGANPNYQQYLKDVGDLWVGLLARGENRKYNPTRTELMEVTGNWFEKKGKGEILGYSKGVIGAARERFIRPVMVTGAPFEIAAHFGIHLGIEYVFAMEVQIGSDNRYTDRIKQNTGLALAKGQISAQLQRARHKILFAMGDMHADIELMRAAIELNDRQDIFGRAVMINARPETIAGLEDWCAGYLASEKITIVKPGEEQDAEEQDKVVQKVRTLLDLALKDNTMKDGRLDLAA